MTADQLVHHYVPKARLKIRWRGESGEDVVHEHDGTFTIRWCPSAGLTGLLHEIGHIRRGHFGKSRYDLAGVASGEETMQEAAAWLWAERTAHRLGIVFDYGQAERCFGTYTRQVVLAWRHR